MLAKVADYPLLIGGDFSMVRNTLVDRSGCPLPSDRAHGRALSNALEEYRILFALSHVWCIVMLFLFLLCFASHYYGPCPCCMNIKCEKTNRLFPCRVISWWFCSSINACRDTSLTLNRTTTLNLPHQEQGASLVFEFFVSSCQGGECCLGESRACPAFLES